MLFKSNGKFVDDVIDSFNRFGLQTKLAEKGLSKNTQKFEMYDTIHDSGYVAVAVDKPFGKNATKEWNNLIEKDLIPTLINENNANTSPASALIVPSKDIDMVEQLLKKKGLSPTVYQLFPGYVVAGISKKDTSKIVNEYLEKQKEKDKEQEKENNKVEEKQPEMPPAADIKKKEELPQKETPKKEDTAKKKEDTLTSLSNMKETKNGSSNIKNEPKEKVKETKKDTAKDMPKKPLSTAKKLAAAALLGTTLGLGALSAPDIKDKIDNYMMSPEEKTERKVLDDAAKKYFENIKNGFPEDDELLKIIAENPQLAKEYINELANTPVQTYALKNKSADANMLREKASSDDEAVRAAVAENPNTPPDILEHLAKDKSNNVLKSLAKNPSISKDMMEDLSNYSGLHNDMLENPAITHEIMRKISAGKNRDCDFNKKYMSNPCLSIDEILYNVNNPDECVRMGLAANPKTPPEAVAALSEDKNPLVKNAAYKHPNLPQEKLNKLFPERWVPEPDNIIKEAERMAALENPNISPEIKEKAILMAPEKYAKAVAANKNAGQGIINKLKNMAQGKKGLETLIHSANDIKNNPEKLANIKSQMDNNKETVDKPVRRMMNKEFVNNVYDPYKLIEDMRKIPSKKKKYNIKKDSPDNKNNNDENLAGYENIVPDVGTPPTILDKFGNAPEYFAKMPLPPLNKGDISYNPDAERAALKTADDIITDLMSDVLPDIEKSIKTSSFTPRNNKAGSSGNNNGTGGNANGGNGAAGGVPTLADAVNNKSNIENKYLTGRQNDIYENACKKIDGLHKMF